MPSRVWAEMSSPSHNHSWVSQSLFLFSPPETKCFLLKAATTASLLYVTSLQQGYHEVSRNEGGCKSLPSSRGFKAIFSPPRKKPEWHLHEQSGKRRFRAIIRFSLQKKKKEKKKAICKPCEWQSLCVCRAR